MNPSTDANTVQETEHEIRRVRSTGDLPDDDLPGRIARLRMYTHQRSGTIGNAAALGHGQRNLGLQTPVSQRARSAGVLSMQQLYEPYQPRVNFPSGDSPRPSSRPFSRGEDLGLPRPPQVMLRSNQSDSDNDSLLFMHPFEREERGGRRTRAGRAPGEGSGSGNGGNNGDGGNGNGTGDGQTHREPQTWWEKLMVFLGRSGPNAKLRSRFVSMVWALSFGSIQFVVIITLLAYAAHHHSPTNPSVSQWDACDKPLGVWNALWLGRVGLGCLIAYYEWRTEHRLFKERQSTADIESGHSTSNTRSPVSSGPTSPLSRVTPASGNDRPTRLLREGTNGPPQNQETQVNPRFLSRLSLLSSVLSLTWFLVAHVFAYSSINTCRHDAPFIWWLTFGILCILYTMIVEIFLIGLLVFILGPVLYLLYSVVLLCLGRHPLQNPHHIKPEIGKLPKSIVDQIPLVFYIPAPEDPTSPPPGKDKETTTSKDGGGDGVIAAPETAHSYPPKPPRPQRKKRFAFLRLKKRSSGDADSSPGKKGEKGKGKDDNSSMDIKSWEDNWVKGEYPFVRLENNRAACAICLMDFEEPERVDAAKEKTPESIAEKVEANAKKKGEKDTEVEETRIRVEEATREESERLKLEDAGEGSQPLRLLACGHCFHQTCIDPWLTNVSGRCPTCQRAIEISEEGKGKKDRRSRRGDSG